MAGVLRTLGVGAVAGGAVFGALTLSQGQDPQLLERIDQLEREVADREVRIAYLKDRERVARIDVLGQEPDRQAGGGLWTTVRFQELGADGEPLGPPQEHRFEGDILYVDARVIKFDDAFVERNDLLRGSSLLTFQRLFGEYERPVDGLALDPVGRRPRAYAGEPGASEFHDALWADFWEHALNPAVARESGVRAMHGEAPYIRVTPGRSYELQLRISEGLTLRPLATP